MAMKAVSNKTFTS